MHEFHFDEDTPGQTVLLPVSNWSHCERELSAAERHAEAHRDPVGAGWTKMYNPTPPPEPLRDLKITREGFAALLAPHGKQFDRLVSPLSAIDEQLGISSIGFGPGGWAGIVADLDGELVTWIWCALPAETAEGNAMLAKMLGALGKEHHLMLVDWQGGELVDLRSRTALETYLSFEG